MLKRIAGLSLMNNSAPKSQPNPTLVALLDQEHWNGTRAESNSSAEESKTQSNALEGVPHSAPTRLRPDRLLLRLLGEVDMYDRLPPAP